MPSDADDKPPRGDLHLPSGEWLGSSGAWAPAQDEARYRERSLLGEGGMGRVVIAEDRILRRDVALKEALGNPDGPESQRLRREARITAALDHPGIVPVFDLGEDDDGRPYYVMRLVRGQSLSAAITAASTPADRLPLVRSLLAACEAVAFAHEAGVVHRDIKPENILVGPWGETQVMDWGLARTLDEDDWDSVLTRDFRTREGAVLGTPAYMSPEQASGEDVGPTTDVWALGAVLYEVIGGQRAVRGPSQREMLAQILSGSRADLAGLAPDADPALIAIAERALSRNPADRYPDAGAMAVALQDWFDGRRTEAPPSHRPGVALAIALLLLIGGAVGWTVAPRGAAQSSAPPEVRTVQDALVIQALDAAGQEDRATAEQLAAEALSLGDHSGARGVLASFGLLAPPVRASAAALPPCPLSALHPRAELFICADSESVSALDLDGAVRWQLPISVDSVRLDVTGERLAVRSPLGARWLLLDARSGDTLELPHASFNPGAKRAGLSLVPHSHVGLMNGRDRSFYTVVADAYQKIKVHTACVEQGGTEWALERAPQVFAVACADRSLVELREGVETPLLPPRDKDSLVWTGDVSPDGRWLALGGVEGDVELIDLTAPSRRMAFDLSHRMIQEVAISSDGALMAARDASGAAWLIPTGDPEGRVRLPGDVVRLGFTADDELVLSRARSLERWVPPAFRVRASQAVDSGVHDLSWSEHGLAGSAANVLRWDADGAGRQVVPIASLALDQVHPRPPEVRSVSWDGDAVLAAGWEVGVVQLDEGGVHRLLDEGSHAIVLASGHRVVLDHKGRGAVVLTPDDAVIPGLSVPGWSARSGAATADGRFAFLDGRAETVVRVVDGAPPTLELLPRPDGLYAGALSADGETLFFTHAGGVSVTQLGDQAPPTRLLASVPGAGGLGITRDGRTLMVGTTEGDLFFLDATDGTERMRIAAHDRRISAMAESPDGRRLATGSWDRTVRLWDLSVLDAEKEQLIAAVAGRWPPAPPEPDRP